MSKFLFFRNHTLSIFTFSLFFVANAQAQDTTSVKKPVIETPSPKKWYETISLRGYTQVRYNRLLETNSKLKCEQCDKSWGDNSGLFFRRIRLIFSGNVSDRVSIYIQPDLASSSVSTDLNFAQIRDAYFDLALDKKKTYRLRFGQSKIPYGFENLQSSQNRAPLDRNDALNSAVANERDIATMFYWAPVKIRERFASLANGTMKGSGDYGVFGLGVYNGQTANKPEANNTLHVVARASYPFQLKNGQIIEPGIQAYTGKVMVSKVGKDVKGTDGFQYTDQRMAGSLILYPKPFGFAAEYNVGTGPEYNTETKTIDQKKLWGGYVQAMYRFKIGQQNLTPFSRYQYYHGGKKQELDARKYRVKEFEIGLEWQPFKNFELVAMYTMSDRTFEDSEKPINVQAGNLLRLQAQFNY